MYYSAYNEIMKIKNIMSIIFLCNKSSCEADSDHRTLKYQLNNCKLIKI